MESWGCESLDLETHQPFIKHIDRIYLPMWLIEKCIDPSYLANIRVKDEWYIKQLADDITKYGLQKPASLTIANNGITLTNGNHRFCAFQLMGKDTFPVKIYITDLIKGAGVSHVKLVPLLLERLYE